MVTVALSVMTSTMSWSSLTPSPTFTSQLTISPSETPSPISGSLNSNFDIRTYRRWDPRRGRAHEDCQTHCCGEVAGETRQGSDLHPETAPDANRPAPLSGARARCDSTAVS